MTALPAEEAVEGAPTGRELVTVVQHPSEVQRRGRLSSAGFTRHLRCGRVQFGRRHLQIW